MLSSNHESDRQKLLAVARYQRWAQLIVILIVAIVVAFILLAKKFPDLELYILLPLWLLSVLYVCLFANALYDWQTAVVYGLLCLVPIAVIYLLVRLNHRACEVFATLGFPVGLLGVSKKAIDKMFEEEQVSITWNSLV